jgi:hypothetical protein
MKLTIHIHLISKLRMSEAVPLLPLYAFMVWTGPLPLLSRHHQPYKPLNQGCYWCYYYRCINFSAVEADELKHCTVIPTPTQTLGPIMMCWTELCCTTLYSSEVTWIHLLPASAATESVTTHTYPCVFKIFSIQQIFLCILFSATL